MPVGCSAVASLRRAERLIESKPMLESEKTEGEALMRHQSCTSSDGRRA